MTKPLKKNPLIIFTGGGSAGHVTPNLALIKRCQEHNWQIAYIGSENGIEKQIIKSIEIPYYATATGKLRRYFSWQNFLDPFKIFWGILQAFFICHKLKPNIIFSKGGFVSFPVVIGAWLNRIPIICHESDFTPGFTTKLTFPFTKYLCVNFADTKKYLHDSAKVILTGTPIRSSLLAGNADKGRALCGFNKDKPILLVTGGGLGADAINFAIRKIVPQLVKDLQIVHLCGKNKTDPQFDNINGYKQFDYVNAEMADLFACANLVVSRAGANAIVELIALRKPNLLIPLPSSSSRGDQLINAEFCRKQGLSEVLLEQDLTDKTLLAAISKLANDKNNYSNNFSNYALPDSLNLIWDLLNKNYK